MQGDAETVKKQNCFCVLKANDSAALEPGHMKAVNRKAWAYLDSSDYSVLSDPRRSETLTPVLERLREWSRRGEVVFCFSGTHLSEMSPLDSKYADAAERRASLLAELCNRNALISLEKLIVQELLRGHGIAEAMPQVHAPTGDWFPEGVAEMSPVGDVDLGKRIVDVIGEVASNRAIRRKVERKALKKGKARSALRSAVVANARSGSLDEILARYPMRPADARVIARYSIGDATAVEAQNAFLESLRDPRWMMQWYHSHHAHLTPFIEWTRRPAKNMLAAIEEVASHAASLRGYDAVLGTNSAEGVFSAERWKQQQDDLLVKIGSRLTGSLLKLDRTPLSAERIDECCPGLSVGVRSLHSAWWTSTQAKPRQAKLSDFPDALHAFYAPYMDVFRADVFMAPFINRHSSRFGTRVVSKLSNLVSELEVVL